MNNRKPEVILIDGAELPVFQLDPDRVESKTPVCANCSWDSLSNEERNDIVASVKEIAAQVRRRRSGQEDTTHGDNQKD